MIAELTDTELKDSYDLVAQHEIESEADEFHIEKVQAENGLEGLKEKSPTEDAKTPEQKPASEVKGVSETGRAAGTEEFSQKEVTAETKSPEEKPTAEVQELSEEEPPAIPKIADPPITMDSSAGIMDLNKLLEDKKAFPGSPACATIARALFLVGHE